MEDNNRSSTRKIFKKLEKEKEKERPPTYCHGEDDRLYPKKRGRY